MSQEATIPQFLLVDGEEHFRDAFSNLFERAGWRLELARDSAAALEKAARGSFDVIITDAELPGLDVLDLLRKLKRERPAQAVIVLSKDYTAQDAVALMKAGALDLIQKPVDLVFLEEALRQAMRLSKDGASENTLYGFVAEESCSYTFTSAELAATRLPLLLAEKLHRSGVISLNTKLELTLAFQEALINSLDHGNLELESRWKEELEKDAVDRYSLIKRERLSDPRYSSRRIFVETKFERARFTIRIRDEGRGFIPDGAPRQCAAPNELPTHGRGISLIFCSMDEVSYSEGGREISMIKRL